MLTEGTKFDGGKVRLDLLAPEFLVGTAKVLEFGAQKYDEYNWAKGMKWSRVFAALMRHMWKWWAGEKLDEETGMSELLDGWSKTPTEEEKNPYDIHGAVKDPEDIDRDAAYDQWQEEMKDVFSQNPKGDDDNEFQLILRQNTNYPSNFSIILGVLPAKTTQLFRLRRYNSKHEHTNIIERETFYDFHIHMATERYQAIGAREDWYAEPTDRFADFHTALECMLNDCNFSIPQDPQLSLL